MTIKNPNIRAMPIWHSDGTYSTVGEFIDNRIAVFNDKELQDKFHNYLKLRFEAIKKSPNLKEVILDNYRPKRLYNYNNLLPPYPKAAIDMEILIHKHTALNQEDIPIMNYEASNNDSGYIKSPEQLRLDAHNKSKREQQTNRRKNRKKH